MKLPTAAAITNNEIERRMKVENAQQKERRKKPDSR